MIDMAQADRTLRTNKKIAGRIYRVINEETKEIVSQHESHGDAIRALSRASIDTHRIVCD